MHFSRKNVSVSEIADCESSNADSAKGGKEKYTSTPFSLHWLANRLMMEAVCSSNASSGVGIPPNAVSSPDLIL